MVLCVFCSQWLLTTPTTKVDGVLETTRLFDYDNQSYLALQNLQTTRSDSPPFDKLRGQVRQAFAPEGHPAHAEVKLVQWRVYHSHEPSAVGVV